MRRLGERRRRKEGKRKRNTVKGVKRVVEERRRGEKNLCRRIKRREKE